MSPDINAKGYFFPTWRVEDCTGCRYCLLSAPTPRCRSNKTNDGAPRSDKADRMLPGMRGVIHRSSAVTEMGVRQQTVGRAGGLLGAGLHFFNCDMQQRRGRR
jgi:hypothetical protein